jgi:hypothetical protein
MSKEQTGLSLVNNDMDAFIDSTQKLAIFCNKFEDDFFSDYKEIRKQPLDVQVEYYKIAKASLVNNLNFLKSMKESGIDQQTKMLQDLILTLNKDERELLANYLLTIIKSKDRN